jgi:hypothetical protein
MSPFFYKEEAGAKGLPPLSPAPPIPADPPPLRSGQFRLTIPNTYSTITMPASLRSDCCSPSLRNAVRLPSGIDVHLRRNTQLLPYAALPPDSVVNDILRYETAAEKKFNWALQKLL